MLIKQPIDISFSKGLDTKTDPKRVSIGNFLQLQNSIFTKGGLLQKRNGYASLPSLPNTSSTYLTTFNGNLTAIGRAIEALSTGAGAWVSRGNIQPLSLSTLPLIRNNLNQTACDAAVAPNGLVCTVYLESNGSSTTNKYAIADSVTGQNIVAPTTIPVTSGTVSGGMRVFVLGEYFVIVFTNTISATTHLQYISIAYSNPTIVTANADIASSYVASSALSWDGYVVGSRLYLAYDTTSGGQAVNVTYLTSIVGTPVAPVAAISFSGYKATLMTVTADISGASPVIYASFYRSDTSVGFTLAIDQNLNLIMNPVEIISSGTILNIVSSAESGSCTIFYEVSNNYSYDSSIPSHYISAVTVTPLGSTFTSVFSSGAGTITVSSATGLVNGMYLIDNTTASNISAGTTFTIASTTMTLSANTAGNSASSPGDILTAATVTSPAVVIRSVGLASKAFIVKGTIYFLGAYSSNYQPTYFLINGSICTASSPVISGKIAYENGGGYLTTGLPGATITGSMAQIPYLYKDLIEAVNKNTNVPSGTQTAGIYSQTGINLATFTLGTQSLDTSEIGNNLHLTGGFLWMYDGYLPVEHNFFLWPDSIEATWTDTPVTPTGTASSGSHTITLSSASGVAVGMSIADSTNSSYIPTGTTITALSGTTATMSNATTHAISGDTLSISGFMASKPDGSTYQNAYYYQVTYEWTDNQGNAFRSAPSIPLAVTTSNDTDHTGSVTLSIPTLRLTMKTANPVKIVVYRWSVAQQNYYQTTSITSPILNDPTVDSVTFVDVNADATILGNNLIYTTGGVVENVNSPASNLLTLFDSRLWLVDAEDPNLVWFSKQVIEATPVEMSDLLTIYVPPNTGTNISTGPVTALSTMDDKVILFKKNAILYINGTGPDNTGSNSQYSPAIFITSTVGCANQYSVVLTPNGLMFQSDKGIWLLGRDLSTDYIGAPVESFTTGATVNSAVLVPETNQVRFTMSSGITLMYDYFYGQWGAFIGVPAVSSCIFNDLHTFINSSGAAYQESSGTYLDGSNPVQMMFQTGPIRLGDLQGYQRVYFFYLLGQYFSPHKLQVSFYRDYATSPSQSVLITPVQSPNPYGSQSPYGQGNPYGGTETLSSLPPELEQWRIFVNEHVARCQAVSIQVQEIFDPTLGAAAGAGLTLSGISAVLGFKRPFRPQPAAISAG